MERVFGPWFNNTDTKKLNFRRKTCRSVTLSTTNPILNDLRSHPDCLTGKSPATNRMSHGKILYIKKITKECIS